jgi:long-chain fatty acid transport protein
LISARPLALALATLTSAGAAWANTPGMYGYGSRSTALSGAVSADVEDFSASYYNPAGLVRAPALRLDVGYLYATHRLRANGRDNHVDPAHGLVGGLVAPGRVFGLPFAFGLGLHLPDDRLSRSRSLPQSQPRWELYDNRVQLLFIAANLAVAPWPWLRIGAGLSFVSSTRGRLDIEGDIAFPSANDSRLRHTVDADLRAVRYPQAGVQIDVLRELTLSMVYRGEFRLQLELDALVAGNVVIGRPSDLTATRIPGSYGLVSRSVAVFLPQQAVLGAAWRVRPNLTVMADLTWIDWSSYINPTAQLVTALSLQIPPDLANLSLPATPPAVVRRDAAFHDTLVPRVGVEWRTEVGVHGLAVRGGYRYDPSPVPDQTGPTNFMDASRHVLSAGAGFTLRGLRPVVGALVLDVHADVQLLERRTVRKDDPADPVGDYVLDGQVFNLGTTMSVLF